MPYPQKSEQETVVDGEQKPLLFLAVAMLAALAGYVNAVMLSFAGLPVSHMSGPATMLGIELGHDDLHRLIVLFGIMISFLFGAMFSGLMISSTVLRPGRRYGVALLIEGLLLAMAGLSSAYGYVVPALMLAAMSCGLQNALAASYRGLTLRTTHVTGIVTDIGVLLAHRFRQKNIKTWKLILLLAILLGFISGGLAGVLAFIKWGPWALYLAASACILIAVAYLPRQEQYG